MITPRMHFDKDYVDNFLVKKSAQITQVCFCTLLIVIYSADAVLYVSGIYIYIYLTHSLALSLTLTHSLSLFHPHYLFLTDSQLFVLSACLSLSCPFISFLWHLSVYLTDHLTNLSVGHLFLFNTFHYISIIMYRLCVCET